MLALALLSLVSLPTAAQAPGARIHAPRRAGAERSGVVVMGTPRRGVQDLYAQGSPRSLNANTTQHGSAQNETSIALDPLDQANLVAATNDYRYGDAGAGIAVSFDGGRTWNADTLAALNPLAGKYSTQGDPALAAYPGGVYYYAYIDFNRGDAQNRLAIARSTDGGVTWPQVGVVMDHTGPGSHDFEDKELIAVDDTGGSFDGNVYVAWTRFPAAGLDRVMFSRSVDGGATFSTPVQISDLADDLYQGTSPAVGPNGEVYVAWYHDSAVQFDRSTDGGVTFGTDVTVATLDDISNPIPGASFRVFSFPSLAVDRSGTATDGNLYIVWADESGPGGQPGILCSRSLDGGSTWSAPIAVCDDTNSAYQWMPAVAVSPGGTLTVSFLDERVSPGNGLYDLYMAQSFDGGASFRPNVRISNETSDSSLDGFGGGFIGDYSGLAVGSVVVAPYWTDCRPSNGNAEGYARGLRLRRP